MKKVNKKSWNVEEVTVIEGAAQRYKGKLIIPLSAFGTSHELMKGGGYSDKNQQGGIIFKNEKVAVEMLFTLQKYFKSNKVTLRKEVYGWLYNIFHEIKLTIKYCLWRNR